MYQTHSKSNVTLYIIYYVTHPLEQPSTPLEAGAGKRLPRDLRRQSSAVDAADCRHLQRRHKGLGLLLKYHEYDELIVHRLEANNSKEKNELLIEEQLHLLFSILHCNG